MMFGAVVINEVVIGNGERAPYVAGLADEGRVGKNFSHISAISDGRGDPNAIGNRACLSLVFGRELGSLVGDPKIKFLFEVPVLPFGELVQWLRQSAEDLRLSAARQNRIRDRMIEIGADLRGITSQSQFWQLVNRVGRVFSPGWDIRSVNFIARN